MKSKELLHKIREMSPEELVAKERDQREELFKLQFQHGVRQVDNTGRLRELKKDIARLKTVISERQQ